MKRGYVMFLSVVLVMCYFVPGYANNPSRLALVIGNANYTEFNKLVNPINDATDLSTMLKNFGFEVILKTNIDNKSMTRAVQEFGEQLANRGGIGLFYFSGHGVQYKNVNYLIPLNTNIKNDADIEFEALNVNRILEYMQAANNDLNIVILDACRESFYKSNIKGSGRGLAQIDSPKGALIAYATAPNKTAYGNEKERNSIYTKHLLAVLRKMPQISITNLFTEITGQVVKATNGEQSPWQDMSLTQQFCFAPCDSSVSSQPLPAKPQAPISANPRPSAQNPLISAGQIWIGYAVCREGLETKAKKKGIKLIINKIETISETQNNVYTIYEYMDANNKTKGKYYLNGQYNSKTGELVLDKVGEWIKHPFMHFPVGMKGNVSERIFAGNILNTKSPGLKTACDNFMLELGE